MVRPTTLSPELYNSIRHRWEDTDEPIETLAIDMGVNARSVRRVVERFGRKACAGEQPCVANVASERADHPHRASEFHG
jgi:hypothetical protein